MLSIPWLSFSNGQLTTLAAIPIVLLLKRWPKKGVSLLERKETEPAKIIKARIKVDKIINNLLFFRNFFIRFIIPHQKTGVSRLF
ncbi:hypothetical protein LAM01_00490 [Amylolactobacillus amylophilus]|nr:hypothetical protein LAM01_00490 [Amylolactobacillus amylophilus]